MKNILLLPTLLILSTLLNAQTITKFAGGGTTLGDGGPATNALIGGDGGIVSDTRGNIYYADGNHNRVRKINAATGIITTYAGTGISGFTGDGGLATSANINGPTWLAIDTQNNLYITDGGNNRIRKVNYFSEIITTVAGSGSVGFSGDGFAATAASFNQLQGIAVDISGNLFIADAGNQRLRKVDATTGLISTYVGTGTGGFSGDGGPATSAEIYGVFGLCVDSFDNLFIADASNRRVRKVDSNGIISTFAGGGVSLLDGVPATTDSLDELGIVIGPSRNLYDADSHLDVIRFIDPAGFIYTVAGDGTPGLSGDGGPATAAEIKLPEGVCFDPCGNMFIADYGNARIRKVTFPGTITPPTISISAAPGDTVCAGTTVTFTSTVTTGGTTPAYQWYVNGTSTGTSSSYSYIPDNGDIVMCILISSSPCASIPDTQSNAIVMVVNPVITPVIAITASPGDTVCAGTSVTFTSSISGGGTSPVYQWYVNGLSAGTSSTYTYVPVDGDVVECKLTTSGPCARIPDTTSNVITMVVNPVITPVIAITASPGDTVCAGTSVTFTSSISGGGTSPAYQWFLNGSPVGASSSYTYTPGNSDVIKCELTSSGPCARIPDTTSNVITMVIDTVITPTISLSGLTSYAISGTVTVTATITGTGSYLIRWMNDGVEFATTTTHLWSPIPKLPARIPLRPWWCPRPQYASILPCHCLNM